MSAEPSPLDIPQRPTERRAWITYRLHSVGLTYRSLADDLGVAHQTVHDVAGGGRASIRLEQAIADAISVDPRELFHEHYSAEGRRLRRARSPKTDKSPGNGTLGNVKNVEAA